MKDIVIKLSTLTIVLCLLLSINTFATPPLNMGQVAPDISLPDQNKTVLSLSSLRGKIVLVQFWASWEPNSRVNNPNLAKIRNQYATATFKNASGFELYTVSLDSENEKWVDAIKNDGLPGSYHVNDFFSKYVGIYKVTKLPASFLLDANGIVIGKNLSNTALQQKLASYSKGGSVAKTAPIYTPPTPIRQTTTTTTDPVAVDQRPNRPDYKIPPPARYRNNSTATNTYRYQPSTQSAPTSGYQPNMQSTVSRSNGNGNTNYVTQSFQVQTPNGIKTVTGLVAAPTAPKTTIYAPIGISYRVQVGAFKQPKMTNFYNASRYGKVLKESTNTGVQRILVGDYNADVHAVDALLKLQSDGYSDAFVVMYENGKRTRVLATEEVSDIAIRMNGSTTVASNATGYTEQKVEQQQPTYMVNKVAPPPPAPIPVSAPVVPAPVPTPPPPTPTPPVPTAPVPSVATAPTPYAAPQYIAPPPPIYYAPQPIYYTPPPIYYTQPQTVYQLPAAPQPQVKETVATPPPASSVAAKPTTPNTGYVGTSTSKSVAVNSTSNSKPVRSNYPMYTGTTTTTRPSSTPTYRNTTTSTPSRSSRITYNNSTSEWKQTIPGTNVTYGLSKSYQDPTSTITSSTSSSYTQSSLASSSPAYSSSTYTGTATTKPYIPPYSGTTTTTKPYTPTYTGRTTTSRPSSGILVAQVRELIQVRPPLDHIYHHIEVLLLAAQVRELIQARPPLDHIYHHIEVLLQLDLILRQEVRLLPVAQVRELIQVRLPLDHIHHHIEALLQLNLILHQEVRLLQAVQAQEGM